MSIAVRTGLEPATPCVTGMYSNQAELPHQNFFLQPLGYLPVCGCKDTNVFHSHQIFQQKNHTNDAFF